MLRRPPRGRLEGRRAGRLSFEARPAVQTHRKARTSEAVIFLAARQGRPSRWLMQCDSLAIVDSRETMMAADELFGELPEQAKPQAEAAPLGAPRMREPQRDQTALRAVDIESLTGQAHPLGL